MTRISDALELLTAQHDELVELASAAKRDPRKVGLLADKLATHLAAEHDLFYPSVAALAPTDEHDQLLAALAAVLASPSAELVARIDALVQLIELHVAREDELFIAISQLLPEGALVEIGEQLHAWTDRSLCIAA